MNIGIVYFTRTGNSKRIAKKIQLKNDGELIELKDYMKWTGIFGFLKGGSYSIKWKQVETYLEPEVDLSKYESLIIVAPMWAGNVAPAVYSLLLSDLDLVSKATLIINSNGKDAVSLSGKIEAKLGKFKSFYSKLMTFISCDIFTK
jgi:flavodoxin